MMIANPTGFTQKLEKDTIVGEAIDAECVVCDNAVDHDQSSSGVVREGLEGNGSSGGEAVGVLGGAGGMAGSGGSVGWKVEKVSGGEEGQPRTDSIEPSDATEPNERNVKRVCANTTERKQKLGESWRRSGQHSAGRTRTAYANSYSAIIRPLLSTKGTEVRLIS